MKNQPLVSIVVPVYNVQKYLKQCLDSIVTQTYKNTEVILVNDGSTDDSGAICDTYCKKNHNFKTIHQKNAGLSAARNSGIDIATGKYITFIDSDDWVEKDYIEKLLNLIQEKDADISAVSRYLEYTNKTISQGDNILSTMNPEECLYRILYSKNIDNSACGKLYKIDLFKNTQYPHGKEFEDTAVTCELVMKSKTITLHTIPMYHYRKNSPGSITHTDFSERKLDLIELAQKITRKITESYPNLKKACDRFLTHAHLSILARAVDSKTRNPKIIHDQVREIKKYRKSVLLDPQAPKSDKLALLSTYFGYKCYHFLWKEIYTKKER